MNSPAVPPSLANCFAHSAKCRHTCRPFTVALRRALLSFRFSARPRQSICHTAFYRVFSYPRLSGNALVTLHLPHRFMDTSLQLSEKPSRYRQSKKHQENSQAYDRGTVPPAWGITMMSFPCMSMPCSSSPAVDTPWMPMGARTSAGISVNRRMLICRAAAQHR